MVTVNYISLEYVKDLVEASSGATNLEAKKRDDYRAWLRFVCFKLSKDFVNKKQSSLIKIGKAYNRDHATVLHGIKQFDALFNQKDFEYCKNVYSYCYTVLNNIKESGSTNANKSIKKTPFEIQGYYKLRHLSYSKRIRKIFDSMSRKIENLSKRDVFAQIALLSDEDLADFEVRANAFLQMKRINNKN